MSWVARKVAGLDNEDQQQVIKEYFEQKAHIINEQKEIEKFWAEYKEDQQNG